MGEKQPVKVSLQPALHVQRHKHFPPTELTLNILCPEQFSFILLHLLHEVTLPILMQLIQRDGYITLPHWIDNRYFIKNIFNAAAEEVEG